jgi:hypothetical protein
MESFMSRLNLIPPAACAAFMAAAAIAHAQTPSATAKADNPPMTAPTAEQQDAIRKLPDQIHDRLTAEGFTDVTVVPGSFIVSGRDKDGKPVLMLIGPNSMQVMTTGRPDDQSNDPSIAESPMDMDNDSDTSSIGKGQVIQQ